MNKSIILVAILLLVVAINLILVIKIRKRSNKIVGLGLSQTVDEIEEGKVWRALLCRCITIGNVITLAGGGRVDLFSTTYCSTPFSFLCPFRWDCCMHTASEAKSIKAVPSRKVQPL